MSSIWDHSFLISAVRSSFSRHQRKFSRKLSRPADFCRRKTVRRTHADTFRHFHMSDDGCFRSETSPYFCTVAVRVVFESYSLVFPIFFAITTSIHAFAHYRHRTKSRGRTTFEDELREELFSCRDLIAPSSSCSFHVRLRQKSSLQHQWELGASEKLNATHSCESM